MSQHQGGVYGRRGKTDRRTIVNREYTEIPLLLYIYIYNISFVRVYSCVKVFFSSGPPMFFFFSFCPDLHTAKLFKCANGEKYAIV